MARKGARFHNAIAQAPWTTPSHHSLLTGYYLASLGYDWTVLNSNTLRLIPQKAKTLAELLKIQGYLTVAFTDGGFVSHNLGFSGGFSFYDEYPYNTPEKRVRSIERWLEKHQKDKFFYFFILTIFMTIITKPHMN